MPDAAGELSPERTPARADWEPTQQALETAALAIPLPEFQCAPPRPKTPKPKPPKKPRRKGWKQLLREYRRRNWQLDRVRPFLPYVWKRRRIEDAVRLDWEADEDKRPLQCLRQAVEEQPVPCGCIECMVHMKDFRHRRFWCNGFKCAERAKFDDVLDLIEHQMAKHGRISLNCPRVLEALGYRVLHISTKRMLPPPSVYVFSQHMTPSARPERWTDKMSVYLERRRMYDGLHPIRDPLVRRYIVGAFEMAALKVEAVGEVELASQYETAMEFYNSALEHQPGDTHVISDGSITVGQGRNWLLSADPENAQFLNQFTYHWGEQADDRDDGEVVLFSIGKISSASGADDRSRGNAASAKSEKALFLDEISRPDAAALLDEGKDQTVLMDARSESKVSGDAQPDEK